MNTKRISNKKDYAVFGIIATMVLAICAIYICGCSGESVKKNFTIAYAPNESTEQSTDARNGLAKDLGAFLGVEVKEIQATDYNAITEALRTGKADMAYLGALSVALAMERAGAEPIVMKAPKGDKTLATYRSVFIAKSDNERINTLRDAKGKKIAFVDPNGNGFLQYVGIQHDTDAFRRFHFLASLGHTLSGSLIVILLKFEAAHQAAAYAADFGGVEGEVLFLGHFDADRLKIAQKAAAADGSAAGTQTAKHSSFVAYADLPQFNAGMEYGSQILHQRTEIPTAVGGEIEENFGIVEGLFNAYQLHIQLVFLDLVLTDLIGFLFKLLVLSSLSGVFLRSDAYHGFECGDD
ncbi:MAG: PhnD/SsuA/transferrin family substrate-binding protein, partial [Fibrobacter sp.]|nr:PhnD/SsuA/transferrin family substrate-binding protein [Fibrobacter sp.]